MPGGSEHRLAVYGTLRPGEANHHQLAALRGDWCDGVLRGRLGAVGPYPGLQLDPEGGEIAVKVFTSADVPDHWARLDRFEGVDYRRVVAAVICDGTPVQAQVYVMASARSTAPATRTSDE